MSACATCGHDHPTRADREACDAMQGAPVRYAQVGNLAYACALCGFSGDYVELLYHFAHGHRGELAPQARLVRPLLSLDTRGDLL